MARTRSLSSIDTEIEKLQCELSKAQEKCDSIAARILELQNQKQLAEAKQVIFCQSFAHVMRIPHDALPESGSPASVSVPPGPVYSKPMLLYTGSAQTSTAKFPHFANP